MNTLLSFGHGYSAQALAKLLLPQGWRVIGTTRVREKFGQMRATEVEPRLFPGDDLADVLDTASHILISAGPSGGQDPVLSDLKDALTSRAKKFAWVGYLSTTGVYGDHQGGWVDEATPANPQTQRGQWRLAAENEWQGIAHLPIHIFRLAGIYGPGRGPFAKLRAGKSQRVIKPGQVFSRIHVEDIAQVLAASIARPNPGAIYNVCDNEPAPPEDVITFAAHLLGMPPLPAVPFEEAALSDMGRSFFSESKRVRNSLLKRELGVVLRYPTYREGLTALAQSDQ